MKKRTIEELHDEYIGHRKFAKICDLLIEDNYSVTDIKEYNEQFKFKVNGHEFKYRKEWKSSAKDFKTYIVKLIYAEERLKRYWSSRID